MAIDTQDKRRSTLGLLAGPRIHPLADGSIGVQDRVHLWLYSGIAISQAIAGPPDIVTGAFSIQRIKVGAFSIQRIRTGALNIKRIVTGSMER